MIKLHIFSKLRSLERKRKMSVHARIRRKTHERKARALISVTLPVLTTNRFTLNAPAADKNWWVWQKNTLNGTQDKCFSNRRASKCRKALDKSNHEKEENPKAKRSHGQAKGSIGSCALHHPPRQRARYYALPTKQKCNEISSASCYSNECINIPLSRPVQQRQQ